MIYKAICATILDAIVVEHVSAHTMNKTVGAAGLIMIMLLQCMCSNQKEQKQVSIKLRSIADVGMAQ